MSAKQSWMDYALLVQTKRRAVVSSELSRLRGLYYL